MECDNAVSGSLKANRPLHNQMCDADALDSHFQQCKAILHEFKKSVEYLIVQVRLRSRYISRKILVGNSRQDKTYKLETAFSDRVAILTRSVMGLIEISRVCIDAFYN